MRFLGIDPGIERTGFAIVERNRGRLSLEAYGVITTPQTLALPERLHQLHTDLSGVLREYSDIVAVGVEELFFAKNVKTAMAVSQARGVILFTLQQFHCTIIDVKPVEVKSAIVGHGRADKKEVQRMVQLQFGLDHIPQPDDAADAIAIALTVESLYQVEDSLKKEI